jgi:hypothetical protein
MAAALSAGSGTIRSRSAADAVLTLTRSGKLLVDDPRALLLGDVDLLLEHLGHLRLPRLSRPPLVEHDGRLMARAADDLEDLPAGILGE